MLLAYNNNHTRDNQHSYELVYRNGTKPPEGPGQFSWLYSNRKYFFEFFPRPSLNRWKTGKHTARYKEQRPLPSMIMAKTTKAATMRFTGTVPDGE